MNVLMVGSGKGSWTIRGEQLGAAIGARVTSQPTREDWRWADVVVLVKRAAFSFGQIAHAFGVPIVWDIVDCWAQPAENALSPTGAVAQLQAQVKAVHPALLIGATQAQAEALGGVYLPHHGRPDLEPQPVRETVQTVAYEGNAAYLGGWLGAVSRLCVARGWRFVVNPPSLSDADLIVALRQGPWDGWICREWKSGVKLVNAITAGRPVITQPTAAWREIGPPGKDIETDAELDAAFLSWTSAERRQAAAVQCERLASSYRLSVIAARYRELLSSVRMPCTA